MGFIKWEFFFLTGPIWGRTLFCIDIRNMVHLHMVKIHLPHIYMFELYLKENKHMNLLYNTPKLFNTFRIISDSLKPFAPNSLVPFQLPQRHFLLFSDFDRGASRVIRSFTRILYEISSPFLFHGQ